MKEIIIISQWLLFSIHVSGLSQSPLLLSDKSTPQSIGSQIDIYEDKTSGLSISEILEARYQSQFIRSREEIPNFRTTHSVIWYRFVLKNTSADKWLLQIKNPYLDTVQLFYNKNNSIIIKTIGSNCYFKDREIKTTSLMFPLNLLEDSVQVYYLRIKHHFVFTALLVGEERRLMETESQNNFLFGLYFGVVFIILLINILLYFSIREISLLYYVFWVICFSVYVSIQKGYFIQIIPDSLFWLNDYSKLSLYIGGIFITVFSNSFLKARHSAPLFNNICKILVFVAIGIIFTFIIGNRQLASILLELFGVVTTIVFIIFSAKIFKRGYKPARFYLIAFSISMMGFCIYALQNSALIPVTNFSQNSLIIGSIWEMIFLTLAIADKINVMRKQRFAIQVENERLVRDHNLILEQKVENRTCELREEKNKSEKLLLNILPLEVANELMNTGSSKPKHFDDITVLFTDFVNFTTIGEKLTPDELVQEINHYFTEFDSIIERNGLEKIKTIGDAYLAVCGMPKEDKGHARKTVKAAMEIMTFINKRVLDGGKFDIRIGINSGSVVAGIVGVKKFAYDIWGDTVNTAARMEQNSLIGKINISNTTYELVKNDFNFTYRGKIDAKNKGEIDMYFVELN